VLNVEFLGRAHVPDTEQEHNLVDLPAGRAAVRPLECPRACGDGSVDERTGVPWLRYNERQREPAEAGRRRARSRTRTREPKPKASE
jgi:hypothetical protein